MKKPWMLATLSSAALAALVVGCATPEPVKPIVGRISALPPIVYPADNPTSPAKVALGKQLFADTRLSGNGTASCQSCHYRNLGWTDANALSKKENGEVNTRHTPTLYNVGHQSVWYWDGRAATMEAQTLAAWRGQIQADPVKATEKINAVPGYVSQFQAIYGGPATPDNIVKSLTTFFRSLNSENAPWDKYELGDVNAVSTDAVEGYKVFAGKGQCIVCHSPPHYGNSTFFNVGLEHGKAKPDVGRFNVTKNPADMSAFKTPTLRSIELSGPYFHDGSVAKLEDAVRYMAGGGKPDPNKSPILRDTQLSDKEIGQVVAFLKTLTSTETWEQPKLP
ncbi:MAG: cytochrome-c peroxidase [Burkholderiaceae bacterium]